MIASGGSPRLNALLRSLFLFAGMALMGSASAQDECSLNAFTGEYLVNGPAQARVDKRDDPTFPRINIGNWRFDGGGNVSAFAIQNHGGQLRRVEHQEGTYTVDSERCVVTVTFPTPTGTTIFEAIMTRDLSEGEAIRTDGLEGQVDIATRHLKKRSKD